MVVNKKKIVGALAIAGTVGLSLLFVSIPSDTLIGYVGTENGYLLMYLIAFMGSITTFAGIPYPLFLINLVAGGFSPIFMGLVSAAGVSTADSFTFFATKKGGALLSEKLYHSFARIAVHIENHPAILTPGLMLYGVVSPLSNDFAVISLSLMQYRYIRVVLPLAVGNVAYNIGIAYLGAYAYSWIVNLF